ncbi:MAG: hypothetical protein ACXIUQ_17195 [Cecembia sp.]
MNRFFVPFAAIISSGIFAYSYWKQWLAIKWWGEKAVIFPEKEQAPYFHASEELYLQVLLAFALVFSLIFLTSIIYAVKRNQRAVFFCFIFSMLAIFAVMVNGAIK